jgi:hypothetical protein
LHGYNRATLRSCDTALIRGFGQSSSLWFHGRSTWHFLRYDNLIARKT